jgi:hypothetical protein
VSIQLAWSPERTHQPDKEITMKTTKPKSTTKTVNLTTTERSILSLCAKSGKATLADMTKALTPKARANAPKRWTYATEVEAEKRIAWCANLLARNGIRKPTRLGLISKVKPGVYAITAAGRKAL